MGKTQMYPEKDDFSSCAFKGILLLQDTYILYR